MSNVTEFEPVVRWWWRENQIGRSHQRSFRDEGFSAELILATFFFA
jgi:hypothetical protein